MEIEKLMQAVRELANAQSGEAAHSVLQRYPELLDESNIQTVSGLAQAARQFDNIKVESVLENVAAFLAKLSQAHSGSVRQIEEAVSELGIGHIPSEASVPWANLTRRYLALRRTELLDQAIAEAKKSALAWLDQERIKRGAVRFLWKFLLNFLGLSRQSPVELGIVKVLMALRARDLQAIEVNAFILVSNLWAAGRYEEWLTVSLIGLEPKVFLAEQNKYFPTDKQALALEALEVGLQACRLGAAIAKALGDEGCQAIYKGIEGSGYARWHRIEEAEVVLQESRELYRRLTENQQRAYEPFLATTLNKLGGVLIEMGRQEEAEAADQEALVIYRKLVKEQPQVFEPRLAQTLNNLGICLSVLKKLAEAETAFRESLSLYKKLAEKQPQIYKPELAQTLGNWGNLLQEQQKFYGAETAYQEALRLYGELAQDYPDAYKPFITGTLYRLGSLLRVLRRLDEAETIYRKALELNSYSYNPHQRVVLHYELGLMLVAGERWKEAAEVLREAIEEVELLLSEGLGLELRIQVLHQHTSTNEQLMISLLKLGRYDEALEVAEQGKSRTLTDLLTLRDRHPKNAPLEKIHEYEQMLFKSRVLENRLRRADIPEPESKQLPPDEERNIRQEHLEAMRQERAHVNSRLHDLVREIRRHDPDLLLHVRTLSFTEIKSLARDAQATLMLFRVTEAGSFIFLVFPDGETDVVQLPEFTTHALDEMLVKFDGGKEVDGWVVRYYDYQDALSRAQQAEGGVQQTKKEEDVEVPKHVWETANQARQAWLNTMEAKLGDIYQRLISLAHQRLKEREQKTGQSIKRVVMVPNRGLGILPLHACWWEEDGKRRYLLDDYVITYAPSLSVFKRCLERERAGRSKQTLLGIANPKPPGNLVFSEWECEEIERLLGDERCLFLWGEEATKNEMMRWIGDRNWLHFSCHGQYRLDAPLESSLSLAQGDELTLGEILEKLNLQHTWLTVLSACETGLVDFREIADEHYGLPLGFLFAGTPTVWGTLWTVNDLTTALLMGEAYKNLTGDSASKPEALRDAQRWLRDAKAEELLSLVSCRQAELGDDRMAWFDLSPFRRSIQYGYDPQVCPYSHPYYWAGMQCVGV